MLEDISSPADLRRLDAAQLDALAAEIRTFIVESVAVTGGHLGSNLGAVELTLAVHRVFDSPRDIVLWDTGPPGLRPQDRHRPRRPLRPAAPGRRAVGLPEPGRVRARLGREQPRLHDPELRPRHRHRRRAGRHRPQGRRHHRRRVDDRRHGLRGPQQPRPQRQAGRDHPQRQRPVSYAPTVVEAQRVVSRLRLNPQYVNVNNRIERLLRDLPAVGELAYSSRCRASRRRCGRCSSRRRSSRPSACATAGPIDGHDIAEAWKRRCATRPSSTARSSSTCSPRRVGATRRPRTTTRRTSTTRRRCSIRPSARPSGGRRRRELHAGVHRGAHRDRPPSTRRSSPSPRPCRGRPACCRSRAASPTGSSTSASPSSTR